MAEKQWTTDNKRQKGINLGEMCFMNKCQEVSGKQTQLHSQSVNLHYKKCLRMLSRLNRNDNEYSSGTRK